MKDKILLLIFQFMLFVKLTESFLDLDELQSIQYGIDIVGKPIVIGQEFPVGSITLSTKFGQQYQCSFPDHAEENAKQKEEEKEAEEIGIVELLKPMEGGPCLFHTKGWWTYELCYGKDIRQYHMEDGKPSGVIMYLGYYESEFDWSNSTETEKKRKSRLNRYHSQQYVNGTTCDLTSNPRRAEVRFQCEEGKGDYISNIDEPESCVYIMNVKTTKICHHPYLKPPVKKTPVPITCNPLITSEQYDEYLAEQEAERLAKEERQREKEKYYASHNIQEPLGPNESFNTGKQGERDLATDKGDDETMMNSAVEALEKLFAESLSKGLQDVLTDANEKAFDKTNKKKEINEDDDEENDNDDEEPVKTVDIKTEPHAHVKDNTQAQSSNTETTDPTDKEAVEQFEKEFDDIANTESRKEHISKFRDNIESAVSAQFNDIVDEAQAELAGEEGIDIDKKEAFAQLSKTLNKLMSKLENTEKEIEDIDNRIEAAEKMKDDLKKEVKEDELQDENKEEEESLFILTDDGKKSAASKSTTDSSQPVNTDTPHTANSQTDTGGGAEKSRQSSLLLPDDGKVKVRVLKISERAKTASSTDKAGTDSTPGQKHLDIPADKKAQLESTVKDTLKKSGLDTQGRKIEVKIITAGYYDDDESTMHILSDTESREFNKMIVTILGGNNEAVREMEHQQEMEDNYGFVWGKDKKNKQSSAEGNNNPFGNL